MTIETPSPIKPHQDLLPDAYQAPRVETVLTQEDLQREVAYAGIIQLSNLQAA